MKTSLGQYEAAVEAGIQHLNDERIMQRIWEHDHTVWNDDPTEISNRLGWLHIMDAMSQKLGRIQHLKHALQEEGITEVLLLGMGGSSLAPEVFATTFGDDVEGLRLQVLDSTDPGAVLAYEQALDPAKTLYVVATKSGGTAETLSAFKYFYNKQLSLHDDDFGRAGEHFVAITDPGSKLEEMAERYRFRATFLNDPNIGGRYSVLSYFGMVPAGLIGLELQTLLNRASEMANDCSADSENNVGARLGVIMGELARAGRDKITLVLSPAIEHFGDWVEQLIAESTGKNGQGILPVVGEALATPDVYGDDRLFAYMKLAGDSTYDAQINALAAAGHPVVTLELNDKYDLGAQFFLWEMATAVAGQRLGIQPFDQPNVEAAKVLAKKMIAAFEEKGRLPELEIALEDDGIAVIGDVQASTPADALHNFLEQAQDGAYISIHAYINPTEEAAAQLRELQTRLRNRTRLATTVGFGPRFLHSTGQLHKGDAGKGLFIQFTQEIAQDVPIPDEAGEASSVMSFGTLKNAQALGDRQALLDVERQVIRFHLNDQTAGLQRMIDAV